MNRSFFLTAQLALAFLILIPGTSLLAEGRTADSVTAQKRILPLGDISLFSVQSAAPSYKSDAAAAPKRCPPDEPELCDPELRFPPSMLPDLLTLPPFDLRLVVNPVNGSRLLRFSNSIMNLGRGPAEVWGVREDPVDHTVVIVQKVYRSDGSEYTLTIGKFVFHPIHGHWHWDNFSQYEVWTVGSSGELLVRAAASGKVGYCLRDNTLVPEEIIDQTGVSSDEFKVTMAYGDCGWRRQGISPGWVDTYRYHLAGQYVDITGLEDGLYALFSIVDPDDRLKESNDGNNAAVVYFRLEDSRIESYGQNYELSAQ